MPAPRLLPPPIYAILMLAIVEASVYWHSPQVRREDQGGIDGLKLSVEEGKIKPSHFSLSSFACLSHNLLSMKSFLVLISAIAAAMSQASFYDNFDRADSGNLGSDWSSDGIGISGGRASEVPVGANALATVNSYSGSFSDTTVSFDTFCTSGSTQYTAAILGRADRSHSAFIKVQSQLSL